VTDSADTPTAYFEQRWAVSGDPWEQASRWYERRKYSITTAALPSPRYDHVLEPACGTGLLTLQLADRADRVTASDFFERAVEETAARCRHLPHVTVHRGDVRDGPATEADLIVLSEVLYYFPPATVERVLAGWLAGCRAGGHIVLVHYRPEVAEHALTGDEVHAIARRACGRPITAVADEAFLLDVFRAG
jgi:SAM-dependent methyltransferase